LIYLLSGSEARSSPRHVALARTFKIIDPALKNPQSEHWERSQRIFDLLL